ncbi:MAG: hypothetical protein J0M00_01960 [Burkholderiales bacterium]|nr:hypothetical protein [Burkholderiales bacterium]
MDALTLIAYTPAAVGVPETTPVVAFAEVMPGAMLHTAVAVFRAENFVGVLVAMIR